MPPKFTLQPVLDYRHNKVELLEVELGRLLQSEQQAQAFLLALEASRARILEQMNENQHGELDLFVLTRLRASLQVVNARIAQQENVLRELADKVRIKRDEMVAARQEEEALVILKNRELQRYAEEQKKADERLQDDIYIAQAHRRSTSPA